MRLINADKLKAHYAWWKGGTRTLTMDEAKSDFDTIVDLQPTIEAVPFEDYRSMEQTVYKLTQALAEAEPIKHGRWIERGDNSWECSECHEISCCKGNYCPDCGADMRGSEDGTNSR